MGATSIEWADWSTNPIRARDPKTGRVGHHCVKVSAGCTHCYSSRLQVRFGLPEFRADRRQEIEPFFDETKLRDDYSAVRNRCEPLGILRVGGLGQSAEEWQQQRLGHRPGLNVRAVKTPASVTP